MTNLWEVNPHLALWRDETYESNSYRAWVQYRRQVEKGLGIASLDGDQDTDGYSIDVAYDFFADGLTVYEAIAEFQIEMQQQQA